MMPTSLRRHYGLEPPYDFSRALLLLISAALVGMLCLATLALAYHGQLTFGTPRFYYFLYLFSLLVVAAALSPYRWIASALLMLFALESGLGFGTGVLSSANLGNSLSPPDKRHQSPFMYHILLQGVPIPNYRGIYYEATVRHNAVGLRGEDIALKGGTKLIFAYGGSTTYDMAVNEGETWVEQLEAELGDEYEVLNFGVPGYSTSEHLIQTAFYGDVYGQYPTCALYYIGWNDIRNAHIPTLDRAYADFHLPSQPASLETRKSWSWPTFSPVGTVLIRSLSPLFDTVPYPAEFQASQPKRGSDPRLEKIFLQNVAAISAINRSRAVKTVFIGQLLNPAQLTSREIYGWLPLIRDADVWPLQMRFNDLLQQAATQLRDVYIDLPIIAFDDRDFADHGHFTERGAKKFAGMIKHRVAEACN